MRKATKGFLAALAFFLVLTSNAFAREQIRIVGSSTVYPFVAAAAEQFGRNTKFKTPVVESTGTGGGLKLFCSGKGVDSPDAANASRPIKESELKLCHENGITNIMEVKIGYDGIVIVAAKDAPVINPTTKQIFLALAKQVAVGGKLVENPYHKWSEIDKSLPDVEIAVYGPPPTSGTRDAFVELAMENGCKMFPEFETAFPDEKERKHKCQLLREDGPFIEAGENDNIIVQKVKTNPGHMGILGHGYYEENMSVLKASNVDGVEPKTENISSGKYPLSRLLYVYFKLAHKDFVPGIQEFAEEMVSERAMGDEGYMGDEGLIPLPLKDRDESRKVVKENQAIK